MDIAPYVERLRSDLAQTTAASPADVREAAERVGLALEPALRLTLMEVLSEAAAEITSSLNRAVVDARLVGRDIEFTVTEEAAIEAAAPIVDEEEGDDGAQIRLTLRLPESVKTRADELAAKNGQSLNSWIIAALRRATRDRAINVDVDLSSIPTFENAFGQRPSPRRMSGWL